MEYNIYIKLTNGCNLKCQHCYNEIMMNKQMMKETTLEDVIHWLKEFRMTHKDDNIVITLHGGEPLLYDIDKTLFLINSTKDLNLSWGITTNLIYNITDKHIELFNMLENKLVKTSWDYKIRFNEQQEQLWLNNIKYLISNGFVVQPIICLTNQLINALKPSYIYNKFIELGIKQLNFERITSTGRAETNNLRPNNKDLDVWLLDAFKEYEKQDLEIPLFRGVLESLKGNYLGCRMRKCMKTVITINPDGSISTCPNMANIKCGTLKETDEIKKQSLYDFENTRDMKCYFCKYFKQCNGDCCQLIWDDTGCPGMLSIFKYLENK